MISRATLLGNIGKIVKNELPNGEFMMTLSIVTKRKYKDSLGTKQEQTSWHHVNFFSSLAPIAEKFAKLGDLVYIEGTISNTKVKGEDKWAYAIMADKFTVIPRTQK